LKIVKEHINEKFTEDSDPIHDMGIGMDALIKRWIENETGYTYNKENLLWICAENGKTEFVKHLIDKGYDVHTEGDLALRLASHNGHIEIVKVLLDAGANVHTDNDYALQLASYYGHTEIVKVLLDDGADVHARSDGALRWASENKHAETVKVLKDWIAKEKKNKVKESIVKNFIDYNSYLFESKENYSNLQYYFSINKKNNIIYMVLMNDDQIIGYINPWHYSENDWEIVGIAAEHGYGYKMHEVAMDLIYPQWIIPIRNKYIEPELFKTYIKFIDRPDIETEKISKDDKSYIKISEKYDDWFNRRYRLKTKLNIDFVKTDYNFVKRAGLKFFGQKYNWRSKTTLN